jgi:LmbE family N-acetylglucosaminyl deacetylase
MSKLPWRALVVSAHPDDIEFGCAGTVALWTDRGAEVTLCLATDGSTGTQDRSLFGEKLNAIRVEETERAAKIMGAKEVVWLGHRDGYVEYTLDLRRDIARAFRQARPHRFVIMDPTPIPDNWFINHPDHRAVGQACLDVSITAGTTPGHFPELLDEGVEPWRGLREVWIVGPGDKPHVVDISSTIDRKIEALLCHASQLGDNTEEVATFVREYTARAGAKYGYLHAETFLVLNEGPGFHAGEQDEDIDLDLAPSRRDFRASPGTRNP